MKRPHIGHLGVIVQDLQATVALMERLFDLKPKTLKHLCDAGLKVAEFEFANLTVEFLEYVGSELKFARQVMGDRTGLNHISITVEDLGVAVDRFSAKGLKVIAGFPRQGAHGRVAFFQPEDQLGFLLEICQLDREGA
jgi:methylmalonyl-CoA/ethylmalonyl-CoA epimerase